MTEVCRLCRLDVDMTTGPYYRFEDEVGLTVVHMDCADFILTTLFSVDGDTDIDRVLEVAKERALAV